MLQVDRRRMLTQTTHLTVCISSTIWRTL